MIVLPGTPGFRDETAQARGWRMRKGLGRQGVLGKMRESLGGCAPEKRKKLGKDRKERHAGAGWRVGRGRIMNLKSQGTWSQVQDLCLSSEGREDSRRLWAEGQGLTQLRGSPGIGVE